MIDPSARIELLRASARDARSRWCCSTSCSGYGAHDDPAGELARSAPRSVPTAGRASSPTCSAPRTTRRATRSSGAARGGRLPGPRDSRTGGVRRGCDRGPEPGARGEVRRCEPPTGQSPWSPTAPSLVAGSCTRSPSARRCTHSAPRCWWSGWAIRRRASSGRCACRRSSCRHPGRRWSTRGEGRSEHRRAGGRARRGRVDVTPSCTPRTASPPGLRRGSGTRARTCRCCGPSTTSTTSTSAVLDGLPAAGDPRAGPRLRGQPELAADPSGGLRRRAGVVPNGVDVARFGAAAAGHRRAELRARVGAGRIGR